MPSAGAETVWAVVPVKGLARAKTRLAHVLSPSARRELVLTMFEEVLDILRGTHGIGPHSRRDGGREDRRARRAQGSDDPARGARVAG